MTADPTGGPGPARPVLRVVRGNPSAEQLAALVAVLGARSAAGAAAPEPTPPSKWASRAAALRRPLPHGPGAWRASALPGAH